MNLKQQILKARERLIAKILEQCPLPDPKRLSYVEHSRREEKFDVFFDDVKIGRIDCEINDINIIYTFHPASSRFIESREIVNYSNVA